MSSDSASNRPHSSVVVDGNDRAPARSMLRAVGFTDEDFTKPQIAVASSASVKGLTDWLLVVSCSLNLELYPQFNTQFLVFWEKSSMMFKAYHPKRFSRLSLVKSNVRPKVLSIAS